MFPVILFLLNYLNREKLSENYYKEKKCDRRNNKYEGTSERLFTIANYVV